MIERYTPVTRDRNASQPNTNASAPGTSAIISIANQNWSKPQPEPRQLLPVQEHHEVGQHRIAVHAARADLPHQIHAHRVAAEREERRVTEAQDAAEAPDEVDGHRQHRVAQVLADQREHERRDVKWRRRRHREVEHRHDDRDDRQDARETTPPPCRRGRSAAAATTFTRRSPRRARSAGTARAADAE